ncbi:hypothetical protein CTAYLR_003338 [Chrysophaeum taylorii]|uniref:NEDD8-activating enzyme E1 regulatory subunit n=1 Tax=Chrysophaeum taylorii TaxID=2483200 RepID=A0AAD7UFA9_9STRA|nr:hypothetical protein CTAYLR_003338 [Chrysophaeum taylorii]
MATKNKYDRQLRLWGAEGQAALSAAHVLLIGAGPTGTEALKNLVLPGVGEFTVVDGERVGESDVASSFFARECDIGRPRAVVACELLLELNPDVRGQSRVVSPEELFRSEPEYAGSFALVIGAQLDPLSLQTVGEACWKRSVPLVVARTCGLVGSVRLQLRRHEVVESKPENTTWDLRVGDPFQTLEELGRECAGMWESWSSFERGRVPYAVILAAVAERFRRERGVLPETARDKADFRHRITQLGGDLENVQEACENCYRVWTSSSSLESLEVRLSHQDASDVTPLVKVLRGIAKFGRIPIAGPIPDMHADTSQFVALQRAYARAANADAKAVRELVPSEVPDDYVNYVCRHLRDVRIVATRSLADELESPDLEDAADALAESDDPTKLAQTPVLWYVALRAADRFLLKRKRWPSTDPLDVKDLVADLQALSAGKLPWTPDTWDHHAIELARFQNAELHAVASVIAAVAAQEAVKLIAHMYLPINHTFFFNAINASAATFEI